MERGCKIEGKINWNDDVSKIIGKIKDEKKFSYDIEIDGGINFENSKLAINAGANILVSGSTIFKANGGNLKKNIEVFSGDIRDPYGVRTAIKGVEEAVSSKDSELAKTNFKSTQKLIDKMANKKVISKNSAGRQKSRLNKAIKSIS